MENYLRRNWRSIFFHVIFIGLVVLSFSSLLRPGYFPMHDDMQAMRILQMKKCFVDGQIPCRWVPDMGYGYGYPQFNFYPPLPYYFMTLVHFAGMSILDSAKLGFIVTFVFSALGMYLLGRILWGEKGGIISALLYTFLPYRAVNVYSRGAMGEIWAMMWFPFIMWSVEMLIRTRKNRYGVLLSISLAGLLTSHLLSSMMFFPVLSLWVLWRLWEERLKTLWSLLVQLTMFGLLGITLSAYYVLPALAEKSSAHFETLLGGYFGFQQHFVSIRQLIFDTYWGYGSSMYGPFDEMAFNVGYLHWLVPLASIGIGIWYGRRTKEIWYVGLLSGLALVLLFMTHVRSSFIWNSIAQLEWLQFPWRFLAPAGFFFSLLAGSIVVWKKEIDWKYLWLLVIPLLLVNIHAMRPRQWIAITDEEKFSGELWDKQQTISIFDYLPISAEHPPVERAPGQPWWVQGDGTIVEYSKGSNWHRVSVHGNEEGQLRLPVFDFPGWVVKVDNEVTAIDQSNELGLITIPIGTGKHEVYAKLMDTPSRLIGNALTLLSLIVLGWLLVRGNVHLATSYEKTT